MTVLSSQGYSCQLSGGPAPDPDTLDHIHAAMWTLKRSFMLALSKRRRRSNVCAHDRVRLIYHPEHRKEQQSLDTLLFLPLDPCSSQYGLTALP